MAISHHVVIRLLAMYRGLQNFEDYVILGDDIVIRDGPVATDYRTFMTRALGVSISPNKTIIARGAAEFAKNLYKNGLNLSPIPPTLVHSVLKFPKLLPVLVMDMRTK